MPRLAEYSQKTHIVTFNGVPQLGLSDDDDAITVNRKEPVYGDPISDAQGNIMHQAGADETGSFIVKTKQTATTLIAFLQSALDTRLPLECGVIDRSTNGACAFCSDGRVSGPPDYVRGKNATTLVWIIKGKTRITHAGQKIFPV